MLHSTVVVKYQDIFEEQEKSLKMILTRAYLSEYCHSCLLNRDLELFLRFLSWVSSRAREKIASHEFGLPLRKRGVKPKLQL